MNWRVTSVVLIVCVWGMEREGERLGMGTGRDFIQKLEKRKTDDRKKNPPYMVSLVLF